MSYHYDMWGWYDGEVKGGERTTEVSPPDAKGDFRPNWTGHEWILQEYKAPPAQAETIAPPTIEERVADIEKQLGISWQ